jgi:hypothetical protein
MATTTTRIFQTGFIIKDGEGTITDDVRFGLIFEGGSYLFPDFNRSPREAVLEGIGGLTIIQHFGHSPYEVAYRLHFDSRDHYRALDALQFETGTLRITHNGHTLPASLTSEHWIHTRVYSEIPNVLLRSLRSLGTEPDGTTEAEAVFTVAS